MAHLPWAELLADGVYCDMHIVSLDDEKIPAHQIVLATQSNAIEEALGKHQQLGEGGFLFRFSFKASIVRQVVKALYTSNFQPLNQPCISTEKRCKKQSVDENERESENQTSDRCPHPMMFCAEAISLLTYLRLKSDNLVRQTWDTLERISTQHLSHVDFPEVFEYTLTYIYELSSSEDLWFSDLYKKHQRVREALTPILLYHPEVQNDLSNLLARELAQTVKELHQYKKQVKELESKANCSAEVTSNTSSSSLDVNAVYRGLGKRPRLTWTRRATDFSSM
ncbi:hypothetical protein B0T11DRAFT_328389 [Plectosphaerella cucumerina]|uniref:BTB domain-containing protein n=1 Tax=Plectosphaerella cucumerina TaxID=40658 RepID=A0A8K0TLA5_9PEZI|nr:hypothetical protein B0T11DRAFT_328389 [Plectosphaerella cucumerina]